MSDVGRLHPDEESFLQRYLPQDACNTAGHGTSDLPFVTLTYASSLDSMIALAPGARTTLSGPETKSMTHYLRLKHDAILVGAGTAATDDPGLNCRYPDATLSDQPRPVVVDPNGRWNGRDKKAYRLASEQSAKPPWIIARTMPDDARALLEIGGEHLEIGNGSTSAEISWIAILSALKAKGVRSVMIEGGATVINSLLAKPHLINAVIITIAPTFLGTGGVAVSPAAKTEDGERVNAAWLDDTSWRQFGNDVVLCGRLRAES